MYMEKSKKKWALVLSILILCAVIVFIMAILPNLLLSYKCKGHCSSVESDANIIAAAISDYFAVPGRTEVKPRDLYDVYTYGNPWTFIQCGKTIYIYVYDLDEDCPVDYQNVHSEWDSHIYTKIY